MSIGRWSIVRFVAENRMRLFKQKPGYSSRPLEWLFRGGSANREWARRFFVHLKEVSADTSSKDANAQGARLLPCREGFRRALRDNPVDVISGHLCDPDPLIRSVSIWLLSQSANRFQLLGINGHCDDPSPMVRKHVAKALYRLEAWQPLQDLAEDFPEDAAIKWFAQPRPNRIEFGKRLSRYAEHMDTSMAETATHSEPMTLWISFEGWILSPPKSRSYIRRILLRIRNAVRGTH